MQKITPFLWFNDQAEEAVKFYASVFKNSKIGNTMRYDATAAKMANRPEGSLMTAEFEIEWQRFVALNGGPAFQFTPAISFMINCKDQEEVDYFWGKLSEGGREDQCGWLQDKFWVSWQVVPIQLNDFVGGSDPEWSKRAMEAMLKMKKLNVKELQEAYEG